MATRRTNRARAHKSTPPPPPRGFKMRAPARLRPIVVVVVPKRHSLSLVHSHRARGSASLVQEEEEDFLLDLHPVDPSLSVSCTRRGTAPSSSLQGYKSSRQTPHYLLGQLYLFFFIF